MTWMPKRIHFFSLNGHFRILEFQIPGILRNTIVRSYLRNNLGNLFCMSSLSNKDDRILSEEIRFLPPKLHTRRNRSLTRCSSLEPLADSTLSTQFGSLDRLTAKKMFNNCYCLKMERATALKRITFSKTANDLGELLASYEVIENYST